MCARNYDERSGPHTYTRRSKRHMLCEYIDISIGEKEKHRNSCDRRGCAITRRTTNRMHNEPPTWFVEMCKHTSDCWSNATNDKHVVHQRMCCCVPRATDRQTGRRSIPKKGQNQIDTYNSFQFKLIVLMSFTQSERTISIEFLIRRRRQRLGQG